MSIHHLHIHIICDSSDKSLHALQDDLTLFFEDKATITRDLFTAATASASYNLRHINACDWVIMLIGESYGQLNNTGVSQQHISYLTAKTKNKPISILVNQAEERPRQLAELLTVIESQNQDIYHIDEDTHFGDLLEALYLTNYPTDITKIVSAPKSKPRPTFKFDEIEAPEEPKLPAKPASTKAPPLLNDEILLNCQAHAFRGGTLIEVVFIAKLTWHTLLNTLIASSPTFNTQGLWQTINRLITSQAMPAVQLNYPDVHAISRCQVTKTDIFWVQEELEAVGWIVRLSGKQRPTWQITEFAKSSAPRTLSHTKHGV